MIDKSVASRSYKTVVRQTLTLVNQKPRLEGAYSRSRCGLASVIVDYNALLLFLVYRIQMILAVIFYVVHQGGLAHSGCRVRFRRIT